VGVNEDRKHTERFVVLDKTHPAHVCGEIIDFFGAFGRDFAILFEVQVQLQVLDVVEALVPLLERLHVYRTNPLISALSKRIHEMAANKPACAGYHDYILS
jgi:hypothetical protein